MAHTADIIPVKGVLYHVKVTCPRKGKTRSFSKVYYHPEDAEAKFKRMARFRGRTCKIGMYEVIGQHRRTILESIPPPRV